MLDLPPLQADEVRPSLCHGKASLPTPTELPDYFHDVLTTADHGVQK